MFKVMASVASTALLCKVLLFWGSDKHRILPPQAPRLCCWWEWVEEEGLTEKFPQKSPVWGLCLGELIHSACPCPVFVVFNESPSCPSSA